MIAFLITTATVKEVSCCPPICRLVRVLGGRSPVLR
ncbi:MAG: hypothetical protein ACJAUC_005001, partial [Planctomycetota bacterium]